MISPNLTNFVSICPPTLRLNGALCSEGDADLILKLEKSELDRAYKEKHSKNFPSNFTVSVLQLFCDYFITNCIVFDCFKTRLNFC